LSYGLCSVNVEWDENVTFLELMFHPSIHRKSLVSNVFPVLITMIINLKPRILIMLFRLRALQSYVYSLINGFPALKYFPVYFLWDDLFLEDCPEVISYSIFFFLPNFRIGINCRLFSYFHIILRSFICNESWFKHKCKFPTQSTVNIE
jgi:hypothetical protein